MEAFDVVEALIERACRRGLLYPMSPSLTKLGRSYRASYD
jgi:hypothetical protein